MNGKAVISASGVGKKFRQYSSVAEGLKEVLHPLRKKYHSDFWALRDLSFEIKRGESVGIVGRNGSGKSTLLQILCGIMPPTEGTVNVNGRVAALLELGAGFHPQFTGRENIFLNGAIMGLSKSEIEERFDDIASFADIGDFIDQPVRTYSSGMYVRLAFAAAINVDPDILIVDEALGVGDEAFQRKCFSHIHSIQKKGTTIIFVSHAATAIVGLCDKTLLLDSGELLMAGAPKTVISRYHKLIYAPSETRARLRNEIRSLGSDSGDAGITPGDKAPSVEPAGVFGEEMRACFDRGLVPKSTVMYESRGAAIENPRIMTLDGEVVNVLVRGEDYIYAYDVRFTEEAYSVRAGVMVKTTDGFELGGMLTHSQTNAVEHIKKGEVFSPRFSFRCIFLPGVYFLNSGVVGMVEGVEEYLHRGTDIAMFRVQPEIETLLAGHVDISPVLKERL